jgi:hypothetical protein
MTRTAGSRAPSPQWQRIEVRMAGSEARQSVAVNGRSATIQLR